jgi:hypothetical protein
MSCNYPQHHRDDRAPGVVQLVALLIVVGAIAIIVTHWRAVLACIVIAGVVLVLVAALMALARNHDRHYDPELEQLAELERARKAQAAVTIAAPAQSPVAAPPAATPAIEPAPAVHQHLHLHGLSGDQMADVVRKALRPPEDPSW